MLDYTYRIWLLKYLAGVFIPPIVVVFVGLQGAEAVNCSYHLQGLAQAAVYILFVPLFWKVAGHIRELRDASKARRLGAKMVPVIRGKRFGDMDLIKRLKDGMNDGYVGTILDELLDENGVNTARISLFGLERVITRDPDVVRFVTATGFANFERGETVSLRAGSFMGRGIFNSDGERWKAHRALARPYFARERIGDYNCFHKYTEKLLAVINSHSDGAIDMQDLFSRFTLDTAGEFLFGTTEFNTLDLPLPKAGKARLGPKGIIPEGSYGTFAENFEQGITNVWVRMSKPHALWTAQEFFDDSTIGPRNALSSVLDPLVQRALDNKRKFNQGEKADDDEEESFLDHLARSTDDVPLVRDQLVNIMIAARDTTSGLLSFTCYLLARHPDVMTRLREEILESHGTAQVPTYDSLKTMKYLRAVLNETLRIFPSAPILSRTSKGPTIIPTRDGPLYIPRCGWQFMLSVVSIQKRKDLWGQDADAFDPDRWLGERGKSIAAQPFQFSPFGAGPRICLGQQFAYNEASFVLVRLLQAFDHFTVAQAEAAPKGSLPPEDWKFMEGRKSIEEIHPQSSITLYSKGGMWLRMRPAVV